MLIPKINMQVWFSDHSHTAEKKEYGAEDRYSSEPQKVHLTGKFVIVAKFGGHALRHLASRLVNMRLVNMIRQGDRLKT